MATPFSSEQIKAAEAQLSELGSSETFANAGRLLAFVEYLVRARLEGVEGELNQSRIAYDVYGRGAGYDPSVDSIVRVEAGRLRSKLRDYYDKEGAEDRVRFDLPKGRYVIDIRFPDTDARSLSSAPKQEIRFCRTEDQVSIAYAVSGRGPTLVKAANWLSHLEFDFDSPIWRHWWRDLSARYRLIRYDERGCGLSDWDVDDFSLEVWTKDLELVANTVGAERFAILGISQGAGVAMKYAALHPERVSHLVIYGGFIEGRLMRNPSPREIEEAELLKDMARVGWGGEQATFRKAFASLFVPDVTEVQIQAFDALQRATTSARNAARFIDAFNRLDAVRFAPLVKAPTLVLHARDEAEVPLSQSQRIAKLIPGARLVTLSSRNHILSESEAAWPEFLEELDSFLGEA